MSATIKRARGGNASKEKNGENNNEQGMETSNTDATKSGHLTSQPNISLQFSTSEQIITLMRKTPADQLPISDSKIFVAQRKDLVGDVWKGLIKHNFLSVPVLQQKDNKYYGFLDLIDIVKFCIQMFGDSKLKLEQDFWSLVKKEEFFSTRTVNDVMVYPLSRRNPFKPVTKGYSLLYAAELLAKEPGLHRVPVVNENRQLVSLITQSNLVKFLHTNMTLLGDIRNKPLSQMHRLHVVFSTEPQHSHTRVVSILNTETAIQAFMKMIDHHVSGVAVVNSEGVLVDNISLKDLKAISSDASLFYRLYQSIDQFLQRVAHDYPNSRPKKVVTLKPTDTIEAAINSLSESGLHRIYVVNDKNKPINVVTLSDILLEILNN